MKIEQRSGTDERRVLTGMILDRQVLSRVAAQWKPPGMFRTPWCNLIGGWCVDYLKRYDQPPVRAIESIYSVWSETAPDQTTADLIGGFLDTLSSEYESTGSFNSDYLIDLAGKHFNTIAMEKLSEAIEAELSVGHYEKAIERLQTWNKVELGVGAGIDVMRDVEAIRRAFESKSEPLITFPGALGEFFGGSLERDAFIAIMSPDKRGKSYWLAEMAYRAMLARRKVAYFEAGDLSEGQAIRRIMVRTSLQPLTPQIVLWPTKIRPDRKLGYWGCEVETTEKVFRSFLSWRRAAKAAEELMTRRVKSDETLWRLSCHPNSTLTISGIDTVLGGWEREGWVPDVLILDYADITASDFPKMDPRHQINETWKGLRRISQRIHGLVLTASQSDAASYKSALLTRSNFTDDKRKLAHVTGMAGLNQTPEEKEKGITRMNWIVRREGAYSETQCVYVASCLALANPAVCSSW